MTTDTVAMFADAAASATCIVPTATAGGAWRR